LRETGADPACLGIEVTEGIAISDMAHASSVLRAIRALGIEIALDDFGTGYSSLGCLRSLPIDLVKVDRSFVHDVTSAPQDVSVTRAIITSATAAITVRIIARAYQRPRRRALWFTLRNPPEWLRDNWPWRSEVDGGQGGAHLADRVAAALGVTQA